MIKIYNVTFSSEEKGERLYAFAAVKAQSFSEAVRDAYAIRHKRGLDWTIDSVILKREN